MKPDDAVQKLNVLLSELNALPADAGSAEFESWRLRTRSVLERALGGQHHMTQEFIDTSWISFVLHGDARADLRAYTAAAESVRGILSAAIAEVGLLSDDAPAADESGIDAELWEHVAPEIQTEAWDKVARGALIFTEDRIRKWAGRPADEVGKDLAIAIFGQNGNFRMGQTDGEMQGWHALPSATRNASGGTMTSSLWRWLRRSFPHHDAEQGE